MRTRCLVLPTLALVVGSSVVNAADDLQIHGFVSQGFLLTHNNALFTPDSEDNGTFEFNEVGVNVVATPIDRLRVGVQLAAQDLGDSFNNEPTIDWAYGNYAFGEVVNGLELAVNAGRFKMGHGLYNDFRDLDMTRSSVFLPMSVYNPRWRDLILAINGVGLTATIDASLFGSFDVNGFIGATYVTASEGALRDLLVDGGLNPSSLNIGTTRGGQITWNTPLDGLRLKYSLLDAAEFEAEGTYIGPVSVPGFVPGTDLRFEIPHYWNNIWSIEYQWDELTLAGEYNYIFYHGTLTGDLNVGVILPDVAVDQTTSTHATYLSAAYRVHPQWEVFGGWQWSTTETPTTNTKWYAWNAAVRYDVTEHWLIKAEYQWTNGAGQGRVAEQADGTTEEKWSYLALKTTFDF